MSYLYGVSDSKYVKNKFVFEIPRGHVTKFKKHEILASKAYFDRKDVPFLFKVTPDSLVELASAAVDKIPLPPVFDWDTQDVAKWIAQYGYPHFRITFRENFINGRRLLLLDASALSAMNIKNLADIRHIVYGIRSLFYFELTKFGKTISLVPNYHFELYKLFRAKSGRTFEEMRETDLWRKMQMLREQEPNLSHWTLLENWLVREPITKHSKLVGGLKRLQLYKCPVTAKAKLPQNLPEVDLQQMSPTNTCCSCAPPCLCDSANCMLLPSQLRCLKPNPKRTAKYEAIKFSCPNCIPPCECTWVPNDYISGTVLYCLKEFFPEKFSIIDDKIVRRSTIRTSIEARWTRYSI